MRKEIYDIAFRNYGFETALDICFSAAECEIMNKVDNKIYSIKYFENLANGFVPFDTGLNLRIRWAELK